MCRILFMNGFKSFLNFLTVTTYVTQKLVLILRATACAVRNVGYSQSRSFPTVDVVQGLLSSNYVGRYIKPRPIKLQTLNSASLRAGYCPNPVHMPITVSGTVEYYLKYSHLWYIGVHKTPL